MICNSLPRKEDEERKRNRKVEEGEGDGRAAQEKGDYSAIIKRKQKRAAVKEAKEAVVAMAAIFRRKREMPLRKARKLRSCARQQ